MALIAPLFFARGDGPVFTVAGSATAHAAVADAVSAPDLRFALGGQPMGVAQQIAQAHWGTNPCKGDVEIVWTALAPDTNATASWRNPTDAWNNPGENFECRIEFNTASDYDWAKFCTVMTHELGHLVGQPHSDRPGELMSPIYSEPLPACDGAEPGAPAPIAEPAVANAEPIVPLQAPKAKPKAKQKPKAAKRPLRAKAKKAKASKRCVRRFRAGKHVRVCATPKQRAAARARR
jgi:hypothetical protein